MLDFFTIFSRGGIVLWYFADQGHHIEKFAAPVNALIKSVILQERVGEGSYSNANLTLKFRLDNEFELVFVIGYQKIVGMSFYDKFLTDVQREFRDRYKNELRKDSFLSNYSNFSTVFKELLKAAEKEAVEEAKKPKKMKTFEQSAKSQKTVASMIQTKDDNQKKGNKGKGDSKSNTGVTSNGQAGKGNKKKASQHSDSCVARSSTNETTDVPKQQESAPSIADIEENRRKMMMRMKKTSKKTSPENTPSQIKKPKGKEKRQWGSGAESEAKLDYGDDNHPQMDEREEDVSNEMFMRGQMEGELRDMEIEESEEEEEEEEEFEEEKVDVPKDSSKPTKSGGFGFFSSLRNLVGSKALTEEDLSPVLAKLKEHIIGKNVAADVADKLCESLANKLEGKVLGTFTSVSSKAKEALEEACLHLLQPKRRINILRDCLAARDAGRPYVITFCGVNGVGKSTNLAKVCFWLVENKLRVLVAACDTFRAGAVEQLKTHVRKLNTLHPPGEDGRKWVQLYEKGYGKDAAGIAMEAINHARDTRIDVVLVDTAGRMQDNEPLMRALAKLIAVNQPDLTLFVGEALVGNDAVDQLVKFNQALADHSHMENPRLIDGIVLTKFDTIDDKVGAAISMTYITGQPIVFVGTGQTYTDLKNLNAKTVVQSLLR